VTAQWYAVMRDVDVTQISGTGLIAWVLELDHGHLMWWDTTLEDVETETLEWFKTQRKFEVIHGHKGCTRLVPVEREHADRGRELMFNNLDDIKDTFADVMKVIDRV
jgi:hypothetical protein